MFPRSGYSRAISAEFGEIDQRLRALERQLERVGGRSAASAAQAAEGVGETIASALNGMAERLRGGANSMRDEAAKISARRQSSATMRCGACPTRWSIARWSRSRLRLALGFSSAWRASAALAAPAINALARGAVNAACRRRPLCCYAVTRRSRRFAVRSKNSAWLATAETVAGWNGLAIRNAGSGRSPVRKRSG